MPTLDALIFPATAGARARVDFGPFRTNTAWTRGAFVRADTLSPATDGMLWESRRQSNHDPNTGVLFDESDDNVDLIQNSGQIATQGDLTTDWLLVVESCDGSQNVTVRVIDVTTPALLFEMTASTTSLFSHGEPAYVYFGAAFNGTAASLLFDGLQTLHFAVKGVELALTDGSPEVDSLLAFAANPLAVGDLWVATYGTNCYFFDNTNADIGPNGAAFTLTGVTLGDENGPTVPDRGEPAASPPEISGVDFFEQLYVRQQRVGIQGTGFGTSVPLVYLATDQDAVSGDPLTVASNSDTAITLTEIVLTSLAADQPMYLNVVNQTPGDGFGLVGQIPVYVSPRPASNVIAIRSQIPAVNMETSTPISPIQLARHFFKSNAQGALTFSATGLPTGLSISSAGVINGTPTAGSYTPTIRATDPNGAFVEQTFSWNIGGSTPTTKLPGSWGIRGRRRRGI